MSTRNNNSKSSSSSKGNKTQQQPEPIVLIVCGLPGSGKSTVSQELEKNGWVRISQDDLGTREECEKLLTKSLKHGHSVIIDRCNVHHKERKMWVQKSREFTSHVEVLFMDTPIEECKARVANRRNHPTLDGEKGAEVIDEFARGLTRPELREGPYKQVMIAANSDECRQITQVLRQYPVKKPK